MPKGDGTGLGNLDGIKNFLRLLKDNLVKSISISLYGVLFIRWVWDQDGYEFQYIIISAFLFMGIFIIDTIGEYIGLDHKDKLDRNKLITLFNTIEKEKAIENSAFIYDLLLGNGISLFEEGNDSKGVKIIANTLKELRIKTKEQTSSIPLELASIGASILDKLKSYTLKVVETKRDVDTNRKTDDPQSQVFNIEPTVDSD